MAMSAHVLERRHAARRGEIVDRLLPIVEELLADGEVSYLDLKVEQIIERAELSRSTFYRHFEDKFDLLLALSEPALADILQTASRPWELPPDASRAELSAEIRSSLERYRPHISLMTAMLAVSPTNATIRTTFERGFDTVRSTIAQHIREGQAKGFIRPDLPAEETAGWLTWMGERGISQLDIRGADDSALNRLEKAFTAITWYTCYDGQGRPDT